MNKERKILRRKMGRGGRDEVGKVGEEENGREMGRDKGVNGRVGDWT